jgi:hypothetical protein
MVVNHGRAKLISENPPEAQLAARAELFTWNENVDVTHRTVPHFVVEARRQSPSFQQHGRAQAFFLTALEKTTELSIEDPVLGLGAIESGTEKVPLPRKVAGESRSATPVRPADGSSIDSGESEFSAAPERILASSRSSDAIP